MRLVVPVFTYNDTVRVKHSASANLRAGDLAWVVGIHTEAGRAGEFLKEFPHGVVYTIEFEDGSSVEIHESLLEKGAFPGEVL
jgi:hypothetical protein